MPNTALSEAIKEAYASAPSEQIILHPDGHPNSPVYGHLKLPHLN